MRLLLRSEIMRIRIGILLTYLLLGCILLEDALPYFAKSNLMEMCESKTETGEKEGKKSKELENEWNEAKDRLHDENVLEYAFLIHPGSIFADSDEIPDSPYQSIFSPPPDRA
ncbi:MAG: hypothetical protein H7246_14635 [Phycisphaerae bacterium]|nr:hypothetical protein [Saprospiraceae bacterium]